VRAVCVSLTATAASNPLCVCAGGERGAGGGGGVRLSMEQVNTVLADPFDSLLRVGRGSGRGL
jgi:hypothetical protein